MSPSPDWTQCPFCLARVRVKEDNTFYRHDRGMPKRRKRCPGSGRTKEKAKEVKAGLLALNDPDEVRPEDIF